MFKYTLTILERVSFDETLFRRELVKATKRLLPSEVHLLKDWVYIFVKKNPHLEPSLQLIEPPIYFDRCQKI